MPSPRSIPFPLQGRTNLIFVCVRARSWWGLAFPLDVLSFARLTKSSPQRARYAPASTWSRPSSPLARWCTGRTRNRVCDWCRESCCRNGDCNREVGRMLALLRSRPLPQPRLHLTSSAPAPLISEYGCHCADTVATPACPLTPTEPQSRQPLSAPLCTRGTCLREAEPSVMPHSVVTSTPSSALTPYKKRNFQPC